MVGVNVNLNLIQMNISNAHFNSDSPSNGQNIIIPNRSKIGRNESFCMP